MTSKQWIAQQKRKLNELVTLFPRAVQTVHTESMKRIYEDGYLSDRGNFRYQYNDTTPVYVNPDDAPRKFTPEGKPTAGKKRGSKKGVKRGLDTFNRKTKYFKSYKAYRAAMGRPTGFVNLDLIGIQRRDNSTSLTKLSNVRYVTGFKNAHNSKKYNGQVPKYGDYTALTQTEHESLKYLIAVQRRRLAV